MVDRWLFVRSCMCVPGTLNNHIVHRCCISVIMMYWLLWTVTFSSITFNYMIFQVASCCLTVKAEERLFSLFFCLKALSDNHVRHPGAYYFNGKIGCLNLPMCHKYVPFMFIYIIYTIIEFFICWSLLTLLINLHNGSLAQYDLWY